MPTIRFTATWPEPDGTAQGETCWLLPLPAEAAAELAAQEETMVEGVINTFPFRAPLQPGSNGAARLKISPAIGTAAGARAQEEVSVEITRMGDEPEVRVPEDLARALEASPQAQEAWQDITPLARRDWVLWATTAKKETTRQGRIAKAVDRVLWATTAKKETTRQGRIAKAVDMLSSGKRRVCCFPGLNWLTRDHVTPEETWQPLPKPTASS